MRNTSYEFEPMLLRGQCLNVVDGQTADVFIDLGWRVYTLRRVGLFGIGTPRADTENEARRIRAEEAKAQLKRLLRPVQISGCVLLGDGTWPLKLLPHPTDDPSLWLVDIWVKEEVVVTLAEPGKVEVQVQEVHVNQHMVELGLADEVQ